MIKTITVPEEIRTAAQKANVERDARRDILLYIMQNDVNISQERINQYQKEYDDKFFEFEKIKNVIEKEYVQPAVDGKASKWSLDYDTCTVTITLSDE